MHTTSAIAESRPAAKTTEAEEFQTGRVLTVSAGHAMHDTYTAFLPSLLPLFIANLALSKTEAGLLTVFMQAPSLLQPLIGHMADRFSLRILFVLAMPAALALVLLALVVGRRPSAGPSFSVE